MTLPFRVPSPRLCAWSFGVFLVAITLFAFRPAWHGDFIWDDDAYVTGNELLTAPNGLRRIWFSFDSPSQYFPLTYTTFRIEHALWGLNPTGYHLVNIALHATNALVLWRLLLRLRIPGAALAAAIFALHPVQVESVAWITERKNVLMGLFFLLTLVGWDAFIESANRRPWRFYALALICYVFALASKSTACTLPAALVAILWLKGQRITLSRVAQIAPFVLFGVLMGTLTIWWERYHQGTRGAGFSMPLIERLLIAARNIWFYGFKTIWPSKLTFIYPRWTLPANDPRSYVWLIAGVLLCAAILPARRRLGRGPEIAAALYVATLGPLLGVIMLYTFRYTFVADHYQYLAIVAPITLFAATIAKLGQISHSWRIAGGITAVVIVGVLAVLTWRQSEMYTDRETLWRTTIARNPAGWMAHNNLGLELAQNHHADDAITEYRRAIALGADGPEADYNLANILNDLGASDEALAHANRAVAINPNDADAHISLGNCLFRLQRYAEALQEYERALALWPGHVDAQYNAAFLLLQTGETDRAIQRLQHLLSQTKYGKGEALLGTALLAEHRYAEAILQLSKGLQSNPSDLTTLTSLAWALAAAPDSALRDGPRAVQLAEQAAELSGRNDPVVLRALAAAHAEAGDPTSALQIAETAFQIALLNGQSDLCIALTNEMSSYRAHQPYHE